MEPLDGWTKNETATFDVRIDEFYDLIFSDQIINFKGKDLGNCIEYARVRHGS